MVAIVSWSELPKDLLISIAKCLETRSDVNRFRAVCSSWRSSISPPQKSGAPPSPLMLPFPVYDLGDEGDFERRGYFKLSESTIYRLEDINVELGTTGSSSSSSQNQWLIRVKETENGKVQILDPFRKVFQAPPHQTLSSKVLDLLKFHVSEIARVYDIEFVDDENMPAFSASYYSLRFHKVILSSKPVSNAHDYAILAMNGEEDLCYTKLGDDKWRTMPDVDYRGRSWSLRPREIVDHNGQFYVIERNGYVLVLDYSFDVVATMAPPSGPAYINYGDLHLVSMGGDLYLVDKRVDEAYPEFGEPYMITFRLTVYKLDDEQQKWEEVKSLGDRALFLCRDGCFDVSVHDFAGFTGGFIYFLDDDPFESDNHIWVFSVEDGRCWRLHQKPF